MKVDKMISSILISVGLFAIPTLVKASELKLANSTHYNLSFKINNVCSAELGDIKMRTIKIINETQFSQACQYNPNQCVIDVYNDEACTGRLVAGMVFENNNIISTASSSDVSVSGNGANVFFTNF